MMRELPTNDLIREVLGDDHSVSLGWRGVVKIYSFGDHYVLEDGSKSILERPDIAKDRDRTQLGVGQILSMGDSAFKGDQFKDWKTIPQVGDFIKWERYTGTFDTENGIDLIDLQDYMVIRIVKNPTTSSYHQWIGN